MDLPSVEAQKDGGLGDCGICYEAYRTPSTSRTPKTLQCGHTLCVYCLKKLMCHSVLLFFVVCPFCRRVTIIPEEVVQNLKTDEETLSSTSVISEVSSGNVESSPPLSSQRLYTHLPSVFTVSEVVSPDQGQLWGGRYMQEIRSTYLLGITRRVALSEAHPTPTPMSTATDRLRLCFALGLIVLIACVFFILIFLK